MTRAHSTASLPFGPLGPGTGSAGATWEPSSSADTKNQKEHGTQVHRPAQAVHQGFPSSSSASSSSYLHHGQQVTPLPTRPNSPTLTAGLHKVPFGLTAAAHALAQAKPPTSFSCTSLSGLTSSSTSASAPSTTAALHIPHMPSSPLVLPRTFGHPTLGTRSTQGIQSQNQTVSVSASASGSPAPSSSLSSSSPLSSPTGSPLRFGTLVNVNGANLPTYALIQQHFQHQYHQPAPGPIVDYFSIPISHPSPFPSHSHSLSHSPYPTPTSEFTMAPPAIASALPLIAASAPPTPADPYAFMSAASGFPLHAAAAAASAAASSAAMYAHHPLLGAAPAGPFQIRILGVPTVGAKSRVETQIKLCLQLVSASGEKVTRYRRLRIPDLLVANDRWKRHGQLASARGAAAAGVPGMVEPSGMSEERDTLWLHGKVICASDPEKVVKVCSGCVQRETKRASRRKYPPKPLPGEPVTLPTPPASVSNSPTARPASAAPTRPAVSDILMSDRKTMLIHAPPVLDFASGDAMLPLRIPCYCRHHKEKLGFILQFELRDTQGRVVAKGDSAPILITDDHKTSKKSQPKDGEANEANGDAQDAVMEDAHPQQQLAQGVKRPSPDGEASHSSTSFSSTSSADEQSPVAHPFSSPMSLLGLPDIRLPSSSTATSSVTLPPASAMPPSPRLSPTSATSQQAALESQQQQQQQQDMQMFGADLLSQVMYLPNMSGAPNASSAVLSSVQSPPASLSTAAESGDAYARKRPRVTPPPPLAHMGGPGQASQVASPISPPHTAHGSPGSGSAPFGNLVFAPAPPMSPSPQRLPPVPSGTISPSSLSFGATSAATAADIEAFTAAIQQPFMAALHLPTSAAQANPAMAAMTTMQPLTLPIVASTASAVDANALMFQQFASSQQQQQPIPLAQFLQAAGAISAVVPQHPPMGVMSAHGQQPLAMAMPAAPAPASTSWLPKLERVVPNEGPLQGGIEVTVLGTGFNESLTVQFGSVPANTVYWSPNTLVCTVPPGTHAGPVPVVIKQVADLGLTDTNQAQAPPATFTYKDANSERQLLELALTLLGYNLTPAAPTSPSPPTSASHSTINPSSLFSLLGNGSYTGHQHLDSTTDALLHMLTDATSATSPLELAALRAVQRMVATHPPASDASAATVLDARRSATGAALVHLAAANKFGRLLRWLVLEAKVDAGVRDGLGRTPLEIAEAEGWDEGVEVLRGVFETPAGEGGKPAQVARSSSPVKSKEGKVVFLDKVEDAVLHAASEKEKALLLTDSTTTSTPTTLSESVASSSTAAVTRTAGNNTLTGWHIHTRIAATFRDPATRWIIQLVLITMLVAAAALQVQQAIVYQGDVWLAKAAKSTIVGVSDALSWLDFPDEAGYVAAPVEEDDGAIVGGVKWQRAVDMLWGAPPQEHQGRGCKVVDEESGRCVEEGGAETDDLWELGRSWRMAVS